MSDSNPITIGRPERMAAAAALVAARTAIAEAVTDEFLSRHPDWVVRYGERARIHGIQDAAFHLDFLAASLDLGAPASFVDYVRWCSRMLQARGIAPSFLGENLEQLVRHAVQQVRPPVDAIIRETVAAAVASLEEEQGEASPVEQGPLVEARKVFLNAIRAGHAAGAERAVSEALETHDVTGVYADVVAAAMVELGELWQSQDVSVADEHRATALAEFTVARMYARLPQASEQRGVAVVSGVQGELHQLGAHLLADSLDADGWDVRFLGTNLPAREIANAVAAQSASLACISTTMLFNLPETRRVVDALASLDSAPRILLGGRAYRAVDPEQAGLGAGQLAHTLQDAVAHARTAGGRVSTSGS